MPRRILSPALVCRPQGRWDRPALEELERLLALAAYIVVRHGDAYMATFEKMERLVEEARSLAGAHRRAELVLADRMAAAVAVRAAL